MQRKFIAFTALFIFCSLLFAGCNPTTTSETPTPGTVLSEETAAPDVETATAEPIESTETTPSAAEDIPCTIAFQSDRDGNWEIYSMASDGSNPVNLTNNESDDTEPAFSPDGSQIAFVSNRADGDEEGQFIYVMNADGSDVR